MWPMLLLGAVQAGSQIYSGYKQKQAADENAQLMREQAQFQKEQAYDQAANIAKEGEAFQGSQRAGFAGSGVKIDSGSPLMVLRETAKNIQTDVSRTQQAGQHAYKSGLNQASALEQQGKDVFTSSLIGGATSFAGTLANNINMPKSTPNSIPTGGGYLNSFTKSSAPTLSSWQDSQLGLGSSFRTPLSGGYSGGPSIFNKKRQNFYGGW